MKRSYLPFIAIGMLLILVATGAMIYLLVWGPGGGVDTVPTEIQVFAATTSKIAPTTTRHPANDANGLAIIRAMQLPKEAQQTLALIAKGGPYPYPRDGALFENRERILAKEASGYSHEYTAFAPGEGDRGARQIITGAGDERFYTADHYETFVRLEEGR